MCIDCACGHPSDRSGDERHIAMSDIRAAASEISVEAVAARIAKEAGTTAAAQR